MQFPRVGRDNATQIFSLKEEDLAVLFRSLPTVDSPAV